MRGLLNYQVAQHFIKRRLSNCLSSVRITLEKLTYLCFYPDLSDMIIGTSVLDVEILISKHILMDLIMIKAVIK